MAEILEQIIDYIQLNLKEVPEIQLARNFSSSGMFQEGMKLMSQFSWKILKLNNIHMNRILIQKNM